MGYETLLPGVLDDVSYIALVQVVLRHEAALYAVVEHGICVMIYAMCSADHAEAIEQPHKLSQAEEATMAANCLLFERNGSSGRGFGRRVRGEAHRKNILS